MNKVPNKWCSDSKEKKDRERKRTLITSNKREKREVVSKYQWEEKVYMMFNGWNALVCICMYVDLILNTFTNALLCT